MKFNVDGIKKFFNDKNKEAYFKQIYWFFTFLTGLYLLIFYFIFCKYNALYFNGYPLDGAFQHLNLLRRLKIGQIPGVDYPAFHGLGIAFLHYPIYYLAGQNFYASELSRYLLGVIFSILPIFVLFRTFLSKINSLYLTIVAALIINNYYLFDFLAPARNPFSSLAVRAALPILIGAYLIKLFKSNKLPLKSALILGFLSASTFFISYEQGIATFIALSASIILFYPKILSILDRIKHFVVFALSFGVSLFLYLFIFCRGHVVEPLKSALINIPMDQFWYFGVDPNNFARKISDIIFRQLPETIPLVISILLIYLIFFTFLLYLNKKEENKKYTVPSIFLLIYGGITIFSNFGYLIPHYFEPLTRILILLAMYLGGIFIKSKYKPNAINNSLMYISGLIILIAVFSINYKYVEIKTPYSLSYADKTSERINGVYLLKDKPHDWKDFYIKFNKNIGGLEKSARVLKYSDQKENWKDGIYKPNKIKVFNKYQGLRADDQIKVGNTMLLVDSLKNNEVLVDNIPDSMKPHTNYKALVIPAKINKNVFKISPVYYLEDKYNSADKNFKGIERIEGGIITYPQNGILTIDSNNKLGAGDQVLTDSGKALTITKTDGDKIYTRGSTLNPLEDGYPHKIILKKRKIPTNITFSLCDYPESAVLLNGDYTNNYNLGKYAVSNGIKKEIVLTRRVYLPELKSYKTAVFVKSGDADSKFFNKVNRIYFPELSQKKYVSKGADIINSSNKLWSEYSSFIEEEYGIYNPTGIDYIIHALGPDNRKKYIDGFNQYRPDFVLTIRQDYFPYEMWLLNETWPFYEQILNNFKIVGYSNFNVFWKRINANTWKTPPKTWEHTITVHNNRPFMLPINWKSVSQKENVLVVNVQYKINNKFSVIPVIGKTPRYLINIHKAKTGIPISLPPYMKEFTFPIYLRNGENPTLEDITVHPFLPANFKVTKVKYRLLKADSAAIRGMFSSEY